MGFKNGAFATVWSVEPKTQRVTRARISVTKKNRDTGEYDQSFGSYVAFVGSSAASRAARLKEKDRIKLLEVDVERTYDKDNQREYINFLVYDFEMADGPQTQSSSPSIDDMVPTNIGDGEEEEDLPF